MTWLGGHNRHPEGAFEGPDRRGDHLEQRVQGARTCRK